MIKITTGTYKQIKKSASKWWHDEDLSHYGKRVDWKESNFFFKAGDGTKVMGYVGGKFESGVVYVAELMVDGQCRGLGVGLALMKQVEKYAKRKLAHKVYLHTGVDWEARGFYEKLGYKKTGDLPNHHFHHDFVIYTKFI